MAHGPTRSEQSIRSCRTDTGFSLIELLAAMGIASLVFATGSTLLSAGRSVMQTQTQRIETVQALRATIDSMTRDLRLAGACLPIQGDFSPIDATNSGTTDTITSRSGLVRPNLTCIYSALTTDAAINATSLTVASTSGFQAGMGGYIFNPVTLTGQDFTIVSISSNTIVSDTKMTQAYSSASGSASTVYAVDRRKYSIDSSSSPPALQVSINGATAMPFASGIESMNIQYRLYRNCPSCDTVDIPASADWPLLNEVILNVTARSQKTDQAGNYFRRSAQFIAKPRNLIPTG
jgi:prepilin-type N-terminal cleavage/methylation domain-containing protein